MLRYVGGTSNYLTRLSRMKVLVVGFGVSGKAVGEYLKKEGHRVIYIDEKNVKSSNVISNFKLERIKELDFDIAVLSSGVKPYFFEEHNIPFMSELDVALSRVKIPYVCVTGTKGKGTCATFIAKTLESFGLSVFLGGNIGEPAIKVLGGRYDVAVFEVSSFQLRSSKNVRPDVALVTNVALDHLDWHTSAQDYVSSKMKLEGTVTIRRFDLGGETVFAGDRNFKLEAENYLIVDDGIWGLINGIKIKLRRKVPQERHKRENVAGGLLTSYYALKKFVNIEPDKFLSELKIELPNLPFRLEDVGSFKGVRIVNDAKSTCPLSLRSALESFLGKSVLIAGGRLKGVDFSGIEPTIKEKVKFAILIGESKETLAKSFEKFTFADSIDEALKKALEVAESGDTVLFSPGCTSFDMFSSAEERGEEFKEAVEQVLK